MSTPTPSTRFSSSQYIPASAWGRDHWSMVAYADSVMTECGGLQVGFDGRMRQARRNFRVMSQQCPKPKRPTRSNIGVPMDPQYGSRLNDGTFVENHDDWACVQDMAEAGMLTVGAGEIEPGVTLGWSDLGREVSHALRGHKQQGGSFSDFVPGKALLERMSGHKPGVRTAEVAQRASATPAPLQDTSAQRNTPAPFRP